MSSARRREAEHILKLCLGDHLRAYQLIERQLSTLARGALLLPFAAGLVVLATGFSGQAIARTSRGAGTCLGAGILFLLVAEGGSVRGALRLRWLSEEIDDEPVVTLLRGLEVRDSRSRHLRRAVSLFAAGFALYCAALAQFLWAVRA